MNTNITQQDREYMLIALGEAKKAELLGEVPVGAVIVCENKLISKGYNKRESLNNALYHAEIEAISGACSYFKQWRLTGCCLYVTLEPCAMCSGAIINARISRVVYGADDPKSGSCGSVVNLFDLPYNHKPELVKGVLQEECSQILKDFFKKLRIK